MNAHATASPATTGSLIILDKDARKYTVPGPPVGSGRTLEYKLSLPGQPCPDNVARKIQLVDFSSATRITLADLPEADPSVPYSFILVLLTTRKITTTEAIELEQIFTYQPGQIVRPGMLLVSKFHRESTQIHDALSLIEIRAPNTPPP